MTAAQGGRSGLVAIGLVLAAALVAAQAVQAWTDWRRTAAATPPGVAAGSLCSVMLVNGQVYYGDCLFDAPGWVGLRDVYYVQVVAAPPGGQPGNRLVSRRKADWHAPAQMTIPLDKVLLIEAVGPASRLAELVKQDRQTAAPAQ